MTVEHGSSSRKIRRLSGRLSAIGVAVVLLCAVQGVQAQNTSTTSASTASVSPFDNAVNIPDLTQVLPAAQSARGVTSSLQILVLLTVLTLVPSILVMMTSFPRVIVVLALLRQAVGAPQLPPGQVLLGLSLFITMIVMAPTWHKIQTQAVSPYLDSRLGQAEAFDITAGHMKDFMYRQIEQAGNYEDVYLFLEYAQDREIPPDEEVAVEQVPLTVMIPAFMLSELKTAFIMGFRVYLPFLVIDMVIATILLSMGMLMLPPVLISLPFKLLLFVLADGWHLIVESVLFSFA